MYDHQLTLVNWKLIGDIQTDGEIYERNVICLKCFNFISILFALLLVTL